MRDSAAKPRFDRVTAELVRSLEELPLDPDRLLPSTVRSIAARFAFDRAAIVRLLVHPSAKAVAVDSVDARGFTEAELAAFLRHVVRERAFEPHGRRGVVHGPDVHDPHGPDAHGDDRMFLPVFDGDRPVAWVGGYRAKPFAPADVAAFGRLAPHLVNALGIDRRLRDARGTGAALAVVLERIPTPAFIADREGHVDHANSAARPLDGERARTAIRDAIRTAGPTDDPAGDMFGATPLGPIPGVPDRYLVVLPDAELDLSTRIERRAAEWKLTSRQAEFLAGMAAGEANKTIAERLGCSEATVETHATAVFRKSGSSGRTAVLAKLLR